MTHGSLFSGIGGFDLAAQWMGWDNIFHCEWNPFCQKVLKHYWPNAHSFNDITTTDFTPFHGRVDILTGGFPCQPFSTAGHRKGTDDDRYLWPEMLRAIREIAPSYVVGENVDGIFTWSNGMVFETVCADLENEGYQVQAYRIPACAKNAPHRRDRWWFVAHANISTNRANGRKKSKKDGFQTINWAEKLRTRQSSGTDFNDDAPNSDHFRQPQSGRTLREIGRWTSDEVSHATNAQSPECQQPRHTRAGWAGFADDSPHATHNGHKGLQRDELGRAPQQRPRPPRPIAKRFENEHWLEAATRLCIVDDGLPGRLDPASLSTKPQHAAGKWRKESLKAAGNAIVPQIAFQIFKAIEATIAVD